MTLTLRGLLSHAGSLASHLGYQQQQPIPATPGLPGSSRPPPRPRPRQWSEWRWECAYWTWALWE